MGFGAMKKFVIILIAVLPSLVSAQLVQFNETLWGYLAPVVSSTPLPYAVAFTNGGASGASATNYLARSGPIIPLQSLTWTVAVWVKPIQWTTRVAQYIFDQRSSTPAYVSLRHVESTRQYTMTYGDVATNYFSSTSAGAQWVNGAWTLCCVVHNGEFTKLFTNGNSTAVITIDDSALEITALDTNGMTTSFGRLNTGAGGWNGTMDNIAVWNRALSTAELSTIYSSGSPVYANTNNAPYNSGLTSLYHMDAGSGTTVADSVGGLDLTATGTKWTTNAIVPAQ